ncbi:MAG: Rid family detoxifying hydrolase [Asticcacaulis sp.]|uniref:RidA family protein n=1 Tax=Asticcacaulis sp. TaxID=1872648 RepID=UPI0039E5C1CE
MSIKRIGGPKAGSGGQMLPFSRATVANGFVFVSGQVGMDETGEIVQGGIVAQTHKTMENIIAILAEAGCTLADVVKANVWLDDTRDFAAFNRVYASYFNGELPARSCVRSQIMIDAKVEVDVIAYKAEA